MSKPKRFSETEFLLAIKDSYSHTEAAIKLGYSCAKHPSYKNTQYGQFFTKLNPDTSHFTSKNKIKRNIGKTSSSKEYFRKYNQIREKEDLQYKLARRLRTRLTMSVSYNYKSGSSIQDLGCSIEKFKLWMEMHWQDGMNWDNYGRDGWSIDHKIPLDQFDLTDRNQLLKACHFTNLQPMWAKDNSSKSNKYVSPSIC